MVRERLQLNNLIPLPYSAEVRDQIIQKFSIVLPLHRSGHDPLIRQIRTIAERHWIELKAAAGALDVNEFVATPKGRAMLYEFLNDIRDEARELVLNWPTDRL